MGGFGGAPLEREAPAMLELRPLSTGEILDRTFTLYRQHFWLYVGLSAVGAAVTTLFSFLQLTFAPKAAMSAQASGDPMAAAMLGLKTGALLFVASVVGLLVHAIVQAAAVFAVETNYLGRSTSIGEAFGSVGGKWYRYVLIVLWQGWSFVWPMLAIVIPASMVAGLVAVAGGGKTAPALVGAIVLLLLLPALVVGVILYLRNSLGVVASVSEKLGVRAAMKRSKFLVADFKMRIFLIYLLLLVLSIVVGAVQLFFSAALQRSHGGVRVGVEILTLLVTFLSGSLVQPVGAIAFVLFYFDQRVRKEGYDVEMLMEKVLGVAPPRKLESPYQSELGQGAASPFSSGPASPFASDSASPFSSGPDSPFGQGTPPPAAGRGDSPFSSGDLPGAASTEKDG